MKFERALTKQQSKIVSQATSRGLNKQLDEFRKKVEEDKATLEQWREKRTGACASSSERSALSLPGSLAQCIFIQVVVPIPSCLVDDALRGSVQVRGVRSYFYL